MPRERWFLVRKGERRGPLGQGPLLSALVQEANPRAVLVWRRGFAEWTRAEDVPEIEQRLKLLLGRPSAPFVRTAGISVSRPAARAPEAPAPTPPAVGRPLLIGAGVGAVLLAALVAWQLARPQPQPAPLETAPFASPSVESSPTAAVHASPAGGESPSVRSGSSGAPTPAARATTAPVHPSAPPALVADREAELPAPELRKLRGVAAWAGETLKLTVYNGTGWRVTELSARVGRFNGEDFAKDERPVRLLPPAGAVDAGVANLLQRVAPDRKRPGLNPFDTGTFEGPAGPVPESYRWEIESARGYPPAAVAPP